MRRTSVRLVRLPPDPGRRPMYVLQLVVERPEEPARVQAEWGPYWRRSVAVEARVKMFGA